MSASKWFREKIIINKEIAYENERVSVAMVKKCTYNMKSCSHDGVLPLTAIVVDFTFCSFKVTYV